MSAAASTPRIAAWLVWLVVATAMLAAVGAGVFWRRNGQLERLRASLPAMPDVTAWPAAFGAALRQAEEMALSSRHALEGVRQLGRLYHANGYSHEAEACWRILQAAQPQEARWCYYLADLRRTVGDDPGMIACLQQTVKRAPDYAPAWLKLAEWEFKTGQMDAAGRDYRRRLALVPGDPYSKIALARLALQRDQRAEAAALLEQIVREAPAFSQAHNLYAEVLAAGGDAAGANQQRFLGHVAGISGRFREADDAWLDELRTWCYDPSRLSLWASVDNATGHGDRGVALLERVIRLAPKDPRGYAELGRTYLRQGDAAKALDLFEQGAQLPGASSDLYAALSEAYRALNLPQKALQTADQGLASMPDAADLQTARGLALEVSGRLEDAVGAYRLAAQRAPNLSETHYNLGNALLRLDRKQEAEACLQRALEINPTFPRALILLGQSELEAGRLDAAARYLRPLYECYPGSVSARRLMTRWCLASGVAAARAGRTDEAEKRLQEGLAISPELPDLHARLGLLYGQEGRLPEALEQLEAYHRLQPTEAMASLFLGQTYARLGRKDDARRLLAEGAQLARQANDTATEAACADELRRLNP
ncbi:MAG TPA: tetratricopeptide repeat protein [Opitutaceae bacterium]|nr:tetratricopeptide repeat protein [Opitutaceae bacterium]